MSLPRSTTLFGILLSFFACTNGAITETRQVSGFTGVESSGPFIVTISLTGTESLRIEADLDDANITKALLTYVENQSLKIRFDWLYNVDDGRFVGLIRIFVSAIQINSIGLTGSGSVFCADQLSAPAISVVNAGTGDVTLTVKSGDLSIVLSGTGNVFVNGSTDTLSGVVSGAGGLGGNGLDAKSVSISIYGSGNVVVNARNMLSVVLMGSGMVKYRGTPMLNIMNMGTGIVSQIQ